MVQNFWMVDQFKLEAFFKIKTQDNFLTTSLVLFTGIARPVDCQKAC